MFISVAHNYMETIDKDYSLVNEYFNNIYQKELSTTTKQQIKKVHKQIWILLIWKNTLKIEHLLYDDILQDMLSIIKTIPLKDVKIINFLIRNISEDFIRLYSFKHQLGMSDSTQPAKIFDTIYSNTNNDFIHKNFRDIHNIYKQTCSYVHSAKLANSIYQCLKDYEGTSNDSIIDKLILNLLQLIKKINNILLVNYKTEFEKINLDYQSIIRDFMEKKDLKEFGY